MVYGQLLKEEAEIEALYEQYLEVVNEAYVGKTDTLLEIEKQIGIVRSKLSKFRDMDGSKEVQQLNRLFEKQFGMKVFALQIDPSDTVNAYTMVIVKNFDIAKMKNLRKYVTADRTYGFRFTPDNIFCITACIYFGLLGNEKLTDGEILGILLHEIGHNFADFIDNKIRIANVDMMKSFTAFVILRAIFSLGLSLIVDLPLYKLLSNKNKTKEAEKTTKKGEKKIAGFFQGLASKIGGFFETISSVVSKYNPINYLLARLDKLGWDNEYNRDAATKSLGRRNEVIADKFAAVYGYGPELGSALTKMEGINSKSYQVIDKLPGGKAINDKWEELYRNINEFDVHPYNIQRINECIKLLEDELNQKSMDPKMKGVIKQQIADLKKLIDDCCNDKDKDEREKKRALYNAYVAKELPDAVTDKIEEEITKEFNEAMEEQDKK